MGKARSFRLTTENEVRMEELCKSMGLDNPNLTLNRVLEDYSKYKKYERLIWILEELKIELNNMPVRRIDHR